MKISEKNLARLSENHKGFELHSFDLRVDDDSLPTARKTQVTPGAVVQADDGTFWVVDKTASGHKLVRKVLDHRSDTYSCLFQSCLVRKATQDEIAKFESERQGKEQAKEAAAAKAIAADDFRFRSDA